MSMPDSVEIGQLVQKLNSVNIDRLGSTERNDIS
jgi:hypothetical protein